jgi:Flp pilus assembly protein TadD
MEVDEEELFGLCKRVEKHLYAKIPAGGPHDDPQTNAEKAANFANSAKVGMWDLVFSLTEMMLGFGVDPVFSHVRAEAYIVKGESWDEVISTCDQLLEAHPDDVRGLYYRALANAHLEDGASAAADLKKAKALDAPDPEVAEDIDTLLDELDD